jgi:cytochrome c oxidase subunit III
MSLYKNVTSKPWEVQGLIGGLAPQPAFAMPPAKFALFLFMVVVAILFSLFTVTYYLRMELGDWVPISTPVLLWLNTVLLVASSFSLQRARVLSAKQDWSATRTAFIIGGLLALAFAAGQYLVWHQLNSQGLFLNANPANTFFYLMTGLHVLHLIGGVWVWGKTSVRLLRGENNAGAALSIELCTLYWHFLLLVWIVLFAILANT